MCKVQGHHLLLYYTYGPWLYPTWYGVVFSVQSPETEIRFPLLFGNTLQFIPHCITRHTVFLMRRETSCLTFNVLYFSLSSPWTDEVTRSRLQFTIETDLTTVTFTSLLLSQFSINLPCIRSYTTISLYPSLCRHLDPTVDSKTERIDLLPTKVSDPTPLTFSRSNLSSWVQNHNRGRLNSTELCRFFVTVDSLLESNLLKWFLFTPTECFTFILFFSTSIH